MDVTSGTKRIHLNISCAGRDTGRPAARSSLPAKDLPVGPRQTTPAAGRRIFRRPASCWPVLGLPAAGRPSRPTIGQRPAGRPARASGSSAAPRLHAQGEAGWRSWPSRRGARGFSRGKKEIASDGRILQISHLAISCIACRSIEAMFKRMDETTASFIYENGISYNVADSSSLARMM